MPHHSPLSELRIASPCPADWANMKGSDQVRHCTMCRLNVYNLSEMTTAEAEQLIRTTEGRLCARFYKRPDGTVITKDCPRGLADFGHRVSRSSLMVAALVVGSMMLIFMRAQDGRLDSNPGTSWFSRAVAFG